MAGLLELDRFFVNQKAKLIELANEYAILDEHGNRVGSIVQEGQSVWKKILRLVSSVDVFMTHRFGVYDAGGAKVLGMVRPRMAFKSRVEVTDPVGVPAGRLRQENLVGKIRFAMEGPSGERLGSVNAENWRAWNFSIQDPQGAEVGRITKQWAGIGKELFTTADNYLVELTPALRGPSRLLALAAAAGIDTALKQTER